MTARRSYEPAVVVDRWGPAPCGAIYEVNVDSGFINAAQEVGLRYGADVLGAITPDDALRLAASLIKAADEAKRHPRWACKRTGG